MSDTGDAFFTGFLPELRRLGLVDGQTVSLEFYSAEGQLAAGPQLGINVLATRPDLLFVYGSTDITRVVDAANVDNVPVLFAVADAFASGLVVNLSRPGGNLTGASMAGVDLEGWRLSMLHEALPEAVPIGYLIDRLGWEAEVVGPGLRRAAERSAVELGLELVPVLSRAPNDETVFREVISGAIAGGVRSLLLSASSPNQTRARVLGGLCTALGLPGMSGTTDFAYGGGLMAYGGNRPELGRRLAEYVARILAGERPADMPVQQPERFDFILNLHAAGALGVRFPYEVLALASEVLE
jgi:putative ABC transport system substrate-binding protein